MDELLGRVMSVAESQMTVLLEDDGAHEEDCRIGGILKAPANGHAVVGAIAATRLDANGHAGKILVVDLLGELVRDQENHVKFSNGVSRYPVSGAPVTIASDADVATVYERPAKSSLRVGTLFQDAGRPAFVLMDELLSRHFAILGSSGSGKSCAVTVILSAILARHQSAHVVLLDPHNEYSTAFGEIAEVVNVDNLQLPLWLFDFEEIARLLIHGGTAHEREAQSLILKDAVTRARRHHAGGGPESLSITVDTPVPFRASDLLRFLFESMGRLDKPDTALPYLRIKSRLESLRDDRRLSFMFSDFHPDTLPRIAGRILRIPVEGKPLTIVDLSGLPSEITDVVVSLTCRLIFDFALWSDQLEMPPVLLVCEEAQRYVPADERIGFAATARAITRIAKEGRKYGVSLALVSQQPSQLSPAAVAQCGTVFSMRLGSDADQQFVARVLPDAARGMLTALPSLPPRQAIVSGQGVALPMRITFDELPPDRRPRSEAARFSQSWRHDGAGAEFCEEVVRRWRSQSRQA
jgi:DNA helicase HerA-like ATPase